MQMYKEKILRLHDDLAAQTDLTIHSWVLREPLEQKVLDELKTKFNIPEDLLGFFRECNGFQVSYTFNSNKMFRKAEFGEHKEGFDPMWPNETYWHLDGCINILPIDQMFRSSWKDYIWFESTATNKITYQGKEYDQLAFEKPLLPFDVFSKSSIVVVRVSASGSELLLSSDHNASYVDFQPLSLTAYVNKVLETKGNVHERDNFFKQIE